MLLFDDSDRCFLCCFVYFPMLYHLIFLLLFCVQFLFHSPCEHWRTYFVFRSIGFHKDLAHFLDKCC